MNLSTRMKIPVGLNVFDAAVERMKAVYANGHRVIISFSGGKDSMAILEVCIIAAAETNRLPVELCMRDEEIMLPGTFEYCERVAARKEVVFHWLVPHHAISNVFNRSNPFWFTFDPRLAPEQWVREPPPFATMLEEGSVERMIIPERFPPPEGKELIAVLGLRANESIVRAGGLWSSGGYLTKINEYGTRLCRPVYDWNEGDVWKATADFKWDYNTAYNTLMKFGISRAKARIAPLTLSTAGIKDLQVAVKAWPRFFDRVCRRCQGVRTVAQYGLRACTPQRRPGESWRDTFMRECIEEAPPFVRERSILAMQAVVARHRRHSTMDLPEITACPMCVGSLTNWKGLAMAMFNGDPMNSKAFSIIPDLEKELAFPWLQEGHPAWMRGDNLPYSEWKARRAAAVGA